MRDEVDGDVEAAAPGHQGVGVLAHRRLVERVDLGRLGRASRRPDVSGDLFEAGTGSTEEVDGGSLAGERAGHRAPDLPPAPRR